MKAMTVSHILFGTLTAEMDGSIPIKHERFRVHLNPKGSNMYTFTPFFTNCANILPMPRLDDNSNASKV